jgi:hypothetical protein
MMFFGTPRMPWSVLPAAVVLPAVTFGVVPLGPEAELLLLLLLPQAASTPVAATADPAPMNRRRVSADLLPDGLSSSVSRRLGSL